MSETKIMNAEVSAHGNTQYGEGYEQGVAFKGTDGFWVLSPKTREELAGKQLMWPPEKGKVVRVELELKPNANKPGKFYFNILRYFPNANGPGESWDHAASKQKESAPQSQTASRPQRHDDDTNRSIGRQVCVKAEAEVLIAILGHAAGMDLKQGKGVQLIGQGSFDALYQEWRDHCRQLFGTAPQIPDHATESDVMGDPALEGDDPLPF